jgi:hypothetical protein
MIMLTRQALSPAHQPFQGMLACVIVTAAGLLIPPAASAGIPSGYTIEALLPPGAQHSVSVRGLYDDGTLGIEVSRGAHNAVGNVDAWVRRPDGTWFQAILPAGNHQINQLGAIGPDGTMYGTWRFNNNIFDQRGFVYTPAGQFTDLGRLDNQAGNPSNTFFGTANADYALCRTANLGYAYRASDGAILPLPSNQPTPGLASAYGSNDMNWFVGVSPSPQGSRATVWRLDSAGAFKATNMGLPPNPIAGATSTGRGVSDAGVAVGYTGTFTDNDAFIWTDFDGMSVLPRLDPARAHFAYDINNDRLVVGYRATGSSTIGAVIWDSTTGQVADLLPLVTNSAGWQLYAAHYINASGVILGRGALDGLSTTYLLTPIGPEGDVNGDGCVDMVDAAILQEAFGQTAAGDVDGDGDTDIDDAVILMDNLGTGC